MPRLGLAIVVVAALASACVADPGPLPYVPTPAEAMANARVRQVFEALEPLVGNAPLECNSNLRGGQVIRVGRATPEALARWFACASAASAARRPFLVVLEHPPFEGWALTGVLGGRDGTLRAFHYYEGCCFPPTPELSAGPCESPSVRTDHGGFYGIGCANEDASGIVPAPELWLRAVPLWRDLEERLHGVTGDDVLDCGLDVYREPRGGPSMRYVNESFDCAESAKASHRSFRLLLQQRGAKSIIVTGLTGTSAGAVSRFRYESSPCGGQGCPSSFEVSPCARPALVRQEFSADVVCDGNATGPAPPFRRRPGS